MTCVIGHRHIIAGSFECRNYVNVDVFELPNSLVASFPHYFVAVVFKRSYIPPLPPLPPLPLFSLHIYGQSLHKSGLRAHGWVAQEH